MALQVIRPQTQILFKLYSTMRFVLLYDCHGKDIDSHCYKKRRMQ